MVANGLPAILLLDRATYLDAAYAEGRPPCVMISRPDEGTATRHHHRLGAEVVVDGVREAAILQPGHWSKAFWFKEPVDGQVCAADFSNFATP